MAKKVSDMGAPYADARRGNQPVFEATPCGRAACRSSGRTPIPVAGGASRRGACPSPKMTCAGCVIISRRFDGFDGFRVDVSGGGKLRGRHGGAGGAAAWASPHAHHLAPGAGRGRAHRGLPGAARLRTVLEAAHHRGPHPVLQAGHGRRRAGPDAPPGPRAVRGRRPRELIMTAADFRWSQNSNRSPELPLPIEDADGGPAAPPTTPSQTL